MKYFCNPVNVNYRYQFNDDPRSRQGIQIAREAADPSMIYFKDRYYIFASMTLGVWVSDDLANWENHRLPENLPLYDYAPDVRVLGEYVYFCASKRGEVCHFYRTKDILNGPYEKIEGSFDFWDPNLFEDEDGRVYFYWGCGNVAPIWGVELDINTMLPVGERCALIDGDAFVKGYERIGEDNSLVPKTEAEVEQTFQGFLKMQGLTKEQIPEDSIDLAKGMFSNRPCMEGAWMTKYRGKYYLQYAAPGAQYNTYADGVYVSDHPLGPFELAENNPYSYKPGGFLPGAGHGSTMADAYGNYWHTSTMRISMNHVFERRVGIWPSGFDKEGELFCNQRYGDWPIEINEEKMDVWKNPKWYLLSYQKKITASSWSEEKKPEYAVDENVQTWWRAGANCPGEWLELDLGESYDVHAIQINFADDKIDIPVPGEIRGTSQRRYIEERDMCTQWKLEGSLDGSHYFEIKDKSEAETDLSHDLVIVEEGICVRFLRLTIVKVPYEQNPCISGFRVFGVGAGEKPEIPQYTVTRTSDLDMEVKIQDNGAVGYNVLWGHTPEKLYHSYMIFNTEQRIGALVKGRKYFVRVDAFNENGITEGTVTENPL